MEVSHYFFLLLLFSKPEQSKDFPSKLHVKSELFCQPHLGESFTDKGRRQTGLRLLQPEEHSHKELSKTNVYSKI